MKNFITIKENIQTEIVVKKSKFICNLVKADTKQEAEEIIKNTKKKYFDARHNCIAYRIAENEKIEEKSSDDGEPAGTAGGPILNILQKNNLCNVVAIVTRYFGGILLGTGGLVKAYSDVTLNALEKCQIVEKCMGTEIECKIEYNYLETFKYYCRKNKINIVDFEYSNIIICKIQIEESEVYKFVDDFDKKNINLIEYRILSKKIINKCI